ncbi:MULTISPECIES: cytochrome P450 [unclassified Gordonia (in: high G+C Gram-positive bacteria)]|nr:MULTISPECIES: cytochrome P450 [unclassified Gordonia (in: high G+C Gram-positive bacteria)]KAF0966992.1 hypothetical protein BPODLACK_04537 [Gordonia sp. YY1]
MTDVTVLFGTETGNAEMVADDIASALGEFDIEATVVGMEDFDVADLAASGTVVLVTSTYGEGELPATTQPFFDAMKAAEPDLTGLRFGAFGLGDSTYDTYNNAIDILVGAVTDAGATQVGATGRHDAASFQPADGPVAEWAKQFAEALSDRTRRGGHEMTAASIDRELVPWSDPEFRNNPYPWYRRLQQDHPVHKLEDGTYLVSRYADVSHFAKLPIMSVEPGWADAGPWAVASDTALGSDPPHHTVLRRQTDKWFTPKLVDGWVRTTRELVGDLLDGVEAGQVIEARRDLAVVPTHVTMARVLQLPEDDADAVMEAMFEAMLMQSAEPADGDVDRAAVAFGYLSARVAEMLEDKRVNPGDGLADSLLDAARAGEITESEAIATILVFYAVGHMAIGYLIASGIELFARRPEVFTAFRNDESARAAIINEMVRMDPPQLSFLRFPTEDVEIGGVLIEAGSPIRFMIGAANRDPEVFDDPDVFDHTRPPAASRNLSFGLGPHSCAGQIISRAEATTVFAVLAERYERIELAEEPTVAHNDFARRYRKLPIVLS